MPNMRLATAFAAALALGAAAPAALAEPAGVQLAQAEQFSDAELDSFVVAALEVSKIRSQYTPRIQGAETEQDKQKLAEEATDKMVQAVQSAPGISIEQYNMIVQAASEDPKLAKQLRERIQQAQ